MNTEREKEQQLDLLVQQVSKMEVMVVGLWFCVYVCIQWVLSHFGNQFD